MTDAVWIVTDNYFSMDPDAGRNTQRPGPIYNAPWMIPASQYAKLSTDDKKKFLKLQWLFIDGEKDSTGREVYLIDIEGDVCEIYAYEGSDDIVSEFEVGPGNEYLNYYGVSDFLTTWKEMKEEVGSAIVSGEPPNGTFTIEKFVTDNQELKDLWAALKKSEREMGEPKNAETNFSAEGVEYKFALIAKYPDTDVSEATWEKIPEGMDAIDKTHVTLVGGQALKGFKQELKEGTKSIIAGMPEPPKPELGRTGVAYREGNDGEVRETYFMEIGNQEDYQDYADKLCDALGIANPEPDRFFHISIANNHGGNPFKSVGDISESDLHGFAADNVPLGYHATLAADGETIVVEPDAWLAETFGLAAPADAYAFAFGEGYRDGRENKPYQPILKPRDRDLFRDSFKLKPDTRRTV